MRTAFIPALGIVQSFLLLAAVPAPTLAADLVCFGSTGRVKAIALDGDYVDVHTNLVVHYPEWKGSADLGGSNVEGLQFTRAEDQRKWSGRIKLKDGKSFSYEQVLRESGTRVRISVKLIAESNAPIEAANFVVAVPVSLFAGGRCEMKDANGVDRGADLPRDPPAKSQHILVAKSDRVALATADGGVKLKLSVDRAAQLTVQDERKWKGTEYSVLVQLTGKDFHEGQTVSAEVTLELSGLADHSPADLTIDPAQVRYRLDGFGGCYCFGVESPVAQYTLDNLKVAWARTEMKLHHWAGPNDGNSPDQIDWETLKQRDKPDGRLRRDFLWMQQLQNRGIPYVISIWQLPDWLYAEANSDARKDSTSARHVAPQKWPELLGGIGTYLLYAKRQYGVEPDLLSFNEPDYGVRVKLTGEEHRDAIIRIGRHLEKLRLKTKMLLADVASARVPQEYLKPTISDPNAMKYVGAVAFHSWGGARPEQYAAWGDTAEKLKLPLLVAEVGVDADWHTVSAWRDTHYYALKEVAMYQELLLHARPQGTMQWELTEDYSTVGKERDAGGWKLTPKKRFWFLKHFFNLTPARSDALATGSSNAKVLVTAFRGKQSGDPAYTVHVANLGASRGVTIRGLPEGIAALNVVRTGETESFQALPAVKADKGVLKLDLPPQSLTTLTTMPVADGAAGKVPQTR